MTKRFAIFIILIIGYIGILFYTTGEISLIPKTSPIMENLSIEQIDKGMVNTKRNGNEYIATNNDPNIVVGGVSNIVGKIYSMDIVVNKMSNNVGLTKLYYWKNGEDMSEFKTVRVSLHKGNNVIKIPFGEKCDNLRFDFSANSGASITIESMGINRNTHLFRKLIMYMIIYIFILLFIYNITYIINFLNNILDKVGMKKKNRFIKILMMILMIKGIFYAVYMIPETLVDAPDEIGHFSYIAYMAYEHRVPILGETNMESTTHEIMNDFVPNSSINDLKKYEITNRFDGSSNWIAQHPPLYYLLCTPIFLLVNLFTNKIIYLVYAIRIFTLLFGVIFIKYVHKTCLKLNLSNNLTKIILLLIVFNPAIQFDLSIINNDSLLIMFSSVSLYYLISYIKEIKDKDYYIFILCCGLMILTKYTSMLIIIPYGLFLIYNLFIRNGLKDTIILLAKGAILGIIMVVPWFIRNIMVYKKLAAMQTLPINENNDTIIQYIRYSKYFDILIERVYYWLGGWTHLLISSKLTRIAFLILVLIPYILIIYKYIFRKRWIKLAFMLMISLLSFIVLKKLEVTYASIILFTSIFGISFFNLLQKRKDKFLYSFQIMSVILVYFGSLLMFYTQYTSYKQYTLIGGIQGRYYVVLFFPFLYIILNSVDIIFRNKKLYDKILGFFIITTILIELCTMVTYMNLWSFIK